jgi:hypothetical protein
MAGWVAKAEYQMENTALRFGPVDIELIRVRRRLSPGQRLQAMLDAREVLVGLIRGRLRRQYPHLSNQELNLKVLEEIERARQIRPRP